MRGGRGENGNDSHFAVQESSGEVEDVVAVAVAVAVAVVVVAATARMTRGERAMVLNFIVSYVLVYLVKS